MGTRGASEPVFDTTPLPAHARVVANADVWMEGEGVAQLARTAALPGCVRAVGMPDLHVGKGPVGAVFAVEGRVYPHLLGGDVGCGVRVVATREKARDRDGLIRRLRQAWDEDPLEGCERAALFEAVFSAGLAGLVEREDVADGLRALTSAVLGETPVPRGPSTFDGREGFADALGTVGGGNHFAEIARVERVFDREAAEALGLERGCLVVVAHSGSRGLGSALARRFGDATATGAAVEAYLADVAGVCQFAAVNRWLLAIRLLRALGAARLGKLAGTFDVTHNDVRSEFVDGRPAWVHRKGAAPAHAGQPTIVLGSRGAPSFVLRGTGEEAGLRSVAHGAGRRMGRAEARDKLRAKYRRADLSRTTVGSDVLCEDPALLYEEHPDAYKPVEPVVASLLDAGLATAVASLVPVVTVKR